VTADNTGAQVSVVIPTRGGPLLQRAVDSALNQDGVSVEVIVALNGSTTSPSFSDRRVIVIETPSSEGANGARSRGIARARSPYTALLDDDDWWHPEKLKLQLSAMATLTAETDAPWIIGCRVNEIHPGGKEKVTPRRFWGKTGPIPAYLFRRTSIISDRPQLQTSTLLFETDLGKQVLFNPGRKFHQDWTWLVEADEIGARAFILDEVLGSREIGTRGSISGGITWRQSLDWANELLVDRRTRGDFSLVFVAAKAARAGSIGGVIRSFSWALRHGEPSAFAMIFGLRMLLAATLAQLRTKIRRLR